MDNLQALLMSANFAMAYREKLDKLWEIDDVMDMLWQRARTPSISSHITMLREEFLDNHCVCSDHLDDYEGVRANLPWEGRQALENQLILRLAEVISNLRDIRHEILLIPSVELLGEREGMRHPREIVREAVDRIDEVLEQCAWPGR